MKKIIIMDDDIYPKISDLPSCQFFDRLKDEDSDEFAITKQYLEDKNIITSTSGIEGVIEHIHSEELLSNTIQDSDYISLFTDLFKDELEEATSIVEQHLSVFSPFIECFNDKNSFSVEKKKYRPANARDLIGYDVIIMDLMMGDDFDNDFMKLAQYLGEIFTEENHPGIFLISSRDELEEQKKLFRKEVKISSLNFYILNKANDLKNRSSLTQIKLAYSQMCQANNASKSIRELSLMLEETMDEAKNALSEQLWTLDYPYLDQMHACTSLENASFSEHFLSILITKLQFNLEANDKLQLSINNLECQLKKTNEKYCSFSKESPNAMHDFEASTYFKGNSLNANFIDYSILNKVKLDNNLINHTIPFGLLLIKNQSDSNHFYDGNIVLLNCTQQCDLSRNIIRKGINPIFIEGVLSNKPSGNYPMPLPTNLTPTKKRFWVNIDENKIIAKPFYELCRYLILNEFKPLTIARDSVVRQIRALSFQNMSRNEAPVKAGHNDLFSLKLYEYSRSENIVIDYKKNGSINKSILLYEYPNNTRNKTYHLLDQENVNIIDWLFDSSNNLKSLIQLEKLESILKEKLPKINKRYEENNIIFSIIDDVNNSQTRFLSDNKTILIEFLLEKN